MRRCYSPKIIGILIAMILTGAARSVGVKIFYQMGFVNPLFVTLLYLLGHSLALLVYGISLSLDERSIKKSASHHIRNNNNNRSNHNTLNSMISKSIHRTSLHDVMVGALLELEFSSSTKSSTALSAESNLDNPHNNNTNMVDWNHHHDGMPMIVSFWGMLPMGEFSHGRITTTPTGNQIEMIMDPQLAATNNNYHPTTTTTIYGGGSTNQDTNNTQATQWGSLAGLNDESKRAVQWIHSIPWYGRPVIPGLCNLFKSALRWASLVHINASVAEILISGLELVFSVLAARWIRKRNVAPVRWMGVGLVLVGIIWVGLTDLAGQKNNTKQKDDTTTTTTSSTMTGLLLIIAQSIMSAIQDIAEEIFMDEANFPATLLLGMEGLLGLGIGLLLYIPTAPLLNEDPTRAWRQFTSSLAIWGYGLFLVLLFLVNGIANILTTCATSSMTRNVWKNIRTVLVWVLALLIFYIAASTSPSTIGTSLGEQWKTPQSFITLLGFSIMLLGIHTYYRITPTNTNHHHHNNSNHKINAATSSIMHERYDDDDDDDDDEINLDQHDPPSQDHPPPKQQQDDETLTIHLEPTPTNLVTMGSMTTERHDNTIRHRSTLPSPKFEIHMGASTRCGRMHSP